jgi:hypothetical protein
MKRLFIVGLVLVAMTAAVSAQELSPNYLGLKGGVNYMKFYGDDVDDAKYLTSFAVGGFYQYQINPRFAISPEVYYSVKGAKEEDSDISVKLSYIEIPVLLKLMFPTESTARPCVYAGGYFSFLMSAKMEDIDIKDQAADTDAGLVFGASVDLLLKEGKQLLNLDLRYSWGLMNISDDEWDEKVYNGGFQFLLGWGFNL